MSSKQPTDIDVHVSSRLKKRREQLELSQEELARKLGLSFQQLQKYENGENRISAGRLFELALALKTSIPYFFEGLESVSRALLRGVSEEGADFEGPRDGETIELVVAFRSVEDPAARKAVLALARKSAAAQKPPRKRN